MKSSKFPKLGPVFFPFIILTFYLLTIPLSSYCQENLNDEEIVRQLKAYVERLDNEGNFSGSVLLAKDSRVLYKNACGLASKRFNIPNKTDTKFNLGSMNKMFTGVAIAQLVEKGKFRKGMFLG